MKKIVIPLVVFLVLAIGSVVFFISMAYTQVQFDKDTQSHMIAVQSGGELTASYAGQETRISADNLSRVEWLLTISERERLFFKPDCDLNDAVCFCFSDGAQYAIAPDASADDAVFLCYSADGSDLWFRIEGYNAMDWAVRTASAEGVNGPNEVIAPEV
jgi:hypothetical protein